MKELSKIEETVLIAIWKLKEEPYGVKIQEQIKAIVPSYRGRFECIKTCVRYSEISMEWYQ